MRQFISLQPRPLVEFPPWVDDLLTVTIGVGLIGLLVIFFMWTRNRRVYRFRIVLLQIVAAAATMDEMQGNDPAWRWDVLSSVTYQQMVRQFWRPLTLLEFFPDPAFIMPPVIFHRLPSGR